MTDSEPRDRNSHWIRPGFVVTLAVLLGAGFWLIYVAPEVGQSSNSPDGRYMALVMRRLDPAKTDPYKFSIRDKMGRIIREFVITPVEGSPSQHLREGPRVFSWSEDSRELTITLDGTRWGTIFLGEPEASQ